MNLGFRFGRYPNKLSTDPPHPAQDIVKSGFPIFSNGSEIVILKKENEGEKPENTRKHTVFRGFLEPPPRPNLKSTKKARKRGTFLNIFLEAGMLIRPRTGQCQKSASFQWFSDVTYQKHKVFPCISLPLATRTAPRDAATLPY